MKKNGVWGKIFMGGMILFFYLPIIYMIVFSFNDSKSLSKFTGFSLQWYEKMFQNHTMIESIWYTVIIAVLATIISTIVGTLASIGLSKSRKIIKEVVLQVNNLPVLNPEIVTAIGFMLFYTSLRMEKGFLTLLLSHIVFCIPYVMLSVMPRLRRLDPNLAEAAMDLGASPFYALRKVIVPQLMPGIIAGALIAFTMSFDDFVISYFVTGNGINNISIMVYTMSKRVNPSINALSTLIVVAISVVLIISNILSMKKKSVIKITKTKAIITTLVVCLGLFGLNALRQKSGSSFDPIKAFGADTLNVFNWGEYVGEHTISKFEEKYNVNVNYSVFASNEEMYTKLLGGDNFDVLIPSDYMIERLIQEDHLRKLNKKNIPNLRNITEGVKNLPYDANNTYAAPYFWGSVGIIYDTTKVSQSDVEQEGFSVLRNTKYANRVYMYDSERDSFMIALKALGYSMNTTDTKQIQEAYGWLIQEKQEMNPVYATDEVIDGMINNERDMAIVYSGDAAYIKSENPNMEYFEPLEGTNLWSDAMVIPKNSSSPELAETFINFCLSEKVAYDNSFTVGYASSIDAVLKKLEKTEFKGNNAYTPRVGYEKDEVFQYNEKTKKLLSELWIKVKASK